MPLKDPAKRREYNHLYWVNRNREERLEYDRRWRAANPEKVREYNHRRYARKHSATALT